MLTSLHISLSLLPLPFYHSPPPLLHSLGVFFWNRPSVMSTEISRHSAGASAGLTFPLPVIYIREGAHGGFSMPTEGRGSGDGEWRGGAGGDGAGTLGLDAARHSNNGGVAHPAESCF